MEAAPDHSDISDTDIISATALARVLDDAVFAANQARNPEDPNHELITRLTTASGPVVVPIESIGKVEPDHERAGFFRVHLRGEVETLREHKKVTLAAVTVSGAALIAAAAYLRLRKKTN